MKIVIPVGSAEREIYQRIGRAPFFAVYNDAEFIELRVNTHAASHHGFRTSGFSHMACAPLRKASLMCASWR